MNEPELNDRQRKFVAEVARGVSAQDAARKAGFSPSYARKSSRLLKHPGIAQAIAAIRAEGRTLVAYDLAAAMREAESAATFARMNKNSMALVKACELRAKLSGLLIERIETVAIDLKGSLEQARARVLDVVSFPRQPRTVFGPATDHAVNGAGDDGGPGTQGDPMGD
jgi:hypothetical protein